MLFITYLFNVRSQFHSKVTLVHLVLKHLKQPKPYVQVLFVDFSSTFNTIQPQVLLEKMKAMQVIPFIMKWYHYCLTGRSQLVRVNQNHSLFDHKHRCSPEMCQFTHSMQMTVHPQPLETSLSNLQTTAILSLLFAHSTTDTYFSKVNRFTEWCTDKFLEPKTH